jgi:hypothetical protein
MGNGFKVWAVMKSFQNEFGTGEDFYRAIAYYATDLLAKQECGRLCEESRLQRINRTEDDPTYVPSYWTEEIQVLA